MPVATIGQGVKARAQILRRPNCTNGSRPQLVHTCQHTHPRPPLPHSTLLAAGNVLFRDAAACCCCVNARALALMRVVPSTAHTNCVGLGTIRFGYLPGALVCATELTLASTTAQTHFMCDPAHSRGSCAIHVQPPSLTTPLRARPGWSQALPTQTALTWRRGIPDALCAR